MTFLNALAEEWELHKIRQNVRRYVRSQQGEGKEVSEVLVNYVADLEQKGEF